VKLHGLSESYQDTSPTKMLHFHGCRILGPIPSVFAVVHNFIMCKTSRGGRCLSCRLTQAGRPGTDMDKKMGRGERATCAESEDVVGQSARRDAGQ